jgi:hypothetical protein
VIKYFCSSIRVGFKWSLTLVALGLPLIFAPNSQAGLIGLVPTPPGSTVLSGFTTDAALAADPSTLLADMTMPYSFTTTAGTTSGTIESAVYRESGGTLDFYYQVANSVTSTTAIARETNTAFAGFTTDTGYLIHGSHLTGTTFVDGTVAPVFDDRNGTGAVNGFLFDLNELSKIHPGETSNVFIISTDATRFEPGNASVIDGGSQTVAAFQPVPGVPEPGSILLISSGLLALAGMRKFRT